MYKSVCVCVILMFIDFSIFFLLNQQFRWMNECLLSLQLKLKRKKAVSRNSCFQTVNKRLKKMFKIIIRIVAKIYFVFIFHFLPLRFACLISSSSLSSNNHMNWFYRGYEFLKLYSFFFFFYKVY